MRFSSRNKQSSIGSLDSDNDLLVGVLEVNDDDGQDQEVVALLL